MPQRLSTLATVLRSATRRVWPSVMGWLRTSIVDQTHVYHPEAHYMRGPGPKWHEKHRRSAMARR